MTESASINNYQNPLECRSPTSANLETARQNLIVADEEVFEDVADVADTFTNPLAEEEEDEDEEAARPAHVIDHDLEAKVRRACERISENVHICANEPSLAFFRLSEHVRKALPPTVESRQQVQAIQRQLGAAYEDADLALRDVQSMENATPSLNSTLEMLNNAIRLQQQINQDQSKRCPVSSASSAATASVTSRASRKPPKSFSFTGFSGFSVS